jgi:hypothetical protein
MRVRVLFLTEPARVNVFLGVSFASVELALVLAGDLEHRLGEAQGLEEHGEEREDPGGRRVDPLHPVVVPPGAGRDPAIDVLRDGVYGVNQEQDQQDAETRF